MTGRGFRQCWYGRDMSSIRLPRRSRDKATRLLGTAFNSFSGRLWGFDTIGPDELRYPAAIFVWVRWLVVAACVLELVYRPVFAVSTYTTYLLCLGVLMAINAYVHYRVHSNRRLSLLWMLALSAMDIALITVSMAAAGGFSHFFFYLLYYPSLAWFAVFFSSFRLSFSWVTLVASLYTFVSLTAGEGLDFDAREEKALFARIIVMYAVVASVNLVARSERIKRQQAVERERELQRQRIEMSHTIHDTTAQSAYMLGLGLEDAIEGADSTNPELAGKLEAMWNLSKSTMWALRQPIDGGQIFSGSTLSEVLDAHAETFTIISSIPAELVQRGEEPELSTIQRSLLFSIAHNALTNAFRHSNADKVSIYLNFGKERMSMSVSDDGEGLPEGYAARGHGFRNMRADAERMGGELEVKSSGNGTTVTCSVPYDRK